MARLNEPPVAPGPSTDTVDAIKRRFLRQNRELAKTNSQQSIRIRNLESEGSRLLAENLSLREQVLQLQNALQSQSGRPSIEDIDVVKSRLEAKLLEFGSLVAELGHMRKSDSAVRRKSQSATKRNPEERQWRSGLGLQAVENAMLPTITEDKNFPRRTMGADEIRDLLADPDSQSPDIGPPPVARFDSEEPLPFDPNPPSEEQADEQPDDPEPELSINLEMRRKRRESGPKAELRRVSFFGSPPDEGEECTSQNIRTGAKRKFSVQEDDDKATKASTEAFRFSRRNTLSTVDDGDPIINEKPQSPSRPVLGNKPVNTDPVLSPKKKRPSTASKPEKKPTSKSTRGRLTITRTTPSQIPPLHIPEPVPTADIHLDPLPPKTPAADDIFSPPSTEPLSSQQESKDTPPPGDINQSDQTGLGMRPSRRARPQVSYKEPSLNTKMRRPGKELVDAVVTSNSRRSSVEPTSTVKREPGENSSAWKTQSSAAGKSAGDVEPGSPLREKLGRRDGAQATETAPEPPKLNSSAASSAISALISATSAKKKAQATSPVTAPAATNENPVSTDPVSEAETAIARPDNPDRCAEEGAASEENDNLAVFDFTDSSPNDPPMSRMRVDLGKASRSARRHSALSTSSTATSSTEEKGSTGLPHPHSRFGSNGTTKSTGINSSRSNGVSKTSTKDKKPSGMGTTGATQSDTKAGSLRAERAASRRKSMLL